MNITITNRVTHDCVQGSEAWHALRAKHYTASEASAMLGVSKYETRASLMKRKATGLAEEIDAATQRRFDGGHAAEAAARPIVEGIIGDDCAINRAASVLARMRAITDCIRWS